MIWLYTGTPRSGKSLHAARVILKRMKKPGFIICNYAVKTDIVKHCRANVIYKDNSELSANYFVQFAMEHHKIGIEGQSLIVIDECQILFNCRDFGRKDRSDWINFFAQHGKLGYDIILITQNSRMLDKQIRSFIEVEVKHRKLSQYGFLGALICFIRPRFAAVSYWAGGNGVYTGKEIFSYQKKYSVIYDSYKMFSEFASADKPKLKEPELTQAEKDKLLAEVLDFADYGS